MDCIFVIRLRSVVVPRHHSGMPSQCQWQYAVHSGRSIHSQCIHCIHGLQSEEHFCSEQHSLSIDPLFEPISFLVPSLRIGAKFVYDLIDFYKSAHSHCVRPCSGNNQLGGTSSAAMAIYAVNSWSDVRFDTGSKSNNFVGTMFCGSGYTASCAIDDVNNEWQCRGDDASSECSDGEDATSSQPTEAPTDRPTPSPTVPVAVSVPTAHPTVITANPTARPSGICIRSTFHCLE